MNSFTGQSIALSDLVQAEEAGLDLNRLLFVKYLVMTKRVTDFPQEETSKEEPQVVRVDRS